jgi:catechol 2,3-dioxygenase-like lactoylglutathione lyase family enzyme
MHHAGFVVKDLERMSAFYREALGLEIVWDRRGVPEYTSKVMGIPNAQTHGIMLQTTSGQRLELLSFETPDLREAHEQELGYGSAHVCFQVDDVQAAYDRLVQHGANVIHPPVQLELDIGLLKGCYARDQEGNWLEILQIDS